jgi:hypothetical protein
MRSWQAKYCLDFPGAPSGTIELVTTHALRAAETLGAHSVTFGGGAAPHVTPGHHMSGTKMKLLGSTYDAIVKQFNLGRKSEFREKMGESCRNDCGETTLTDESRCHARSAVHCMATPWFRS